MTKPRLDPWEARYGHHHMDQPPTKPKRRITMKTPPEEMTRDELIAHVKKLRKKVQAWESGNWGGPG